MTHHIVGFRNPIPNAVVKVFFELEELFWRIWYPDIDRGNQGEVKLYILAGWTIRQEAVE